MNRVWILVYFLGIKYQNKCYDPWYLGFGIHRSSWAERSEIFQWKLLGKNAKMNKILRIQYPYH